MTSMRIDGGKSASVWDDRVKKLIQAAMDDGCKFYYSDLTEEISVSKDGEEWVVLEMPQ